MSGQRCADCQEEEKGGTDTDSPRLRLQRGISGQGKYNQEDIWPKRMVNG